MTPADGLGRGLLLAPAIFVAHFVEESRGPGAPSRSGWRG